MQDSDRRAYGLEHGAPPVAAGTILVDFDGTLFPWDDLFVENPPLPGAVDAMRRFKEAGLRIYIFTSRVSNVWLNDENQDVGEHIAHVTKMLNKYDIHFDGITADKRPAVAYIDDNAERLTSIPNKTNIAKFTNWKELADKYAKGTEHEHEFFLIERERHYTRQYAYCSCGKVRIKQDNEDLDSYYEAEQDHPNWNPTNPD